MKKKLIVSVILTVFILIGAAWAWVKAAQPKIVHYHAGFLVYVDGKLQDFSGDQYMSIDFCSKDPAAEARKDPQKEKAHLHDNTGDVVHVHRDTATWEDLFRNIGYAFPSGSEVAVYREGSPGKFDLSLPIKPYDSVIIVSGSAAGADLTHFVTRQHIREVEKKSETCAP